MAHTLKHVIIACHPLKKSFTLAVAERYAKAVQAHGHEVVLRDLYRMRFDPVLKARERGGQAALDVVREWGELGKPEVFVLIYPIWFGTPPAMLKGYIDRVFGAGRTRGAGGKGGTGELLAGKRLVSLTSSGGSSAWLAEKGVLGSLRTVYDRYMAEVFGLSETHRYHFDGIVDRLATREFNQRMLEVDHAAREVMARMSGEWIAEPERERD